MVRASGIATVSDPRLLSKAGRVRVAQCVSAVGAVEVCIYLRTLSCSMTQSVARIRVVCHQVTPEVLNDLC
jgi:hypothetical protein